MKRVLVTGATGFIGRHCLSPLLARGYEVHAVSRRGVGAGDEVDINWHAADLLAPGCAAYLVDGIRPSHLMHFAWYTASGKYWTSPENLRWVEASLSLLRAFAENGGRRAVFAGTCAEYEWRFGYCSEDVTPSNPVTLYGVCKNALREIVACYAHACRFSAVWTRLFFLYGPHEAETRLVPKVIKGLLGGESVQCTHGLQIRDYLHVCDAAEALAALLDSKLQGTVNVASGRPVAVRDIVQTLADVIGNGALLEWGALETAPDEPPLLVADVRRLVEATDWRPRIDLPTGLRDTINWWRSHCDKVTK